MDGGWSQLLLFECQHNAGKGNQSPYQPVHTHSLIRAFVARLQNTIFDLITTYTPISAQSKVWWSSDYSQYPFCLLLYRGIC